MLHALPKFGSIFNDVSSTLTVRIDLFPTLKVELLSHALRRSLLLNSSHSCGQRLNITCVLFTLFSHFLIQSLNLGLNFTILSTIFLLDLFPQLLNLLVCDLLTILWLRADKSIDASNFDKHDNYDNGQDHESASEDIQALVELDDRFIFSLSSFFHAGAR